MHGLCSAQQLISTAVWSVQHVGYVVDITLQHQYELAHWIAPVGFVISDTT
jgi:hypothetical protein